MTGPNAQDGYLVNGLWVVGAKGVAVPAATAVAAARIKVELDPLAKHRDHALKPAPDLWPDHLTAARTRSLFLLPG